jgi:phosphatidylglycerol:prolipoprotein diacylglycerol transferase
MEKSIKHSSVLVVRKAFEVSLYVTVFALASPLFFYLMGLLLDRTANPFTHIRFTLDVSGATLLGCGAGVMLLAVTDLGRRGRGLPASPVPPAFLVTEGIYGLSRHPIYFGASLSFLGGSLILHSFWSAFLSWPLFTLFFVAYALRVEEPILEHRFGAEYLDYRRRTPLLWDFPLRGVLFETVSRFLARMSSVVNRPFILRFGSHLLFLGYGLWVGFGIFMGLTSLNIVFLADGIGSGTTAWLMVVFTVGSLAGSRIVSMFVLMNLEKTSIQRAWHRVGFVSWGALLAAVLTGGIFALLTGRSLYYWFDAAFTGLMISHFFGRIGCLFYGCCYGKETGSAISIHYRHPVMKSIREGLVEHTRLYPVQLFSSLFGLFTFLVVFFLWSMTRIQVGLPTSLCCLLYGIFRFYEEWFRYQKRKVGGVLSPAQIISLVLVLFGILQLGWICPASGTGFHARLFHGSTLQLIRQLNIWVALAMGLLTALVFSYHRYEIGAWGKLGITGKFR